MITQVVNGPVLLTLAIVWALLVVWTLAQLHQRRIDIHQSILNEMQAWRAVQHWISTEAATTVLSPFDRHALLQLLQRQATYTTHEASAGTSSYSIVPVPGIQHDSYSWIEAELPALLTWCYTVQSQSKSKHMHVVDLWMTELSRLFQTMLNERRQRWLAVMVRRLPRSHYALLALLAGVISVSFLIATDEAEFVMINGLPVRILWSLLMSSMTAIGVLLWDGGDRSNHLYLCACSSIPVSHAMTVQ
jgi:hypothetical protein